MLRRVLRCHVDHVDIGNPVAQEPRTDISTLYFSICIQIQLCCFVYIVLKNLFSPTAFATACNKYKILLQATFKTVFLKRKLSITLLGFRVEHIIIMIFYLI